MIEDIPLIIPNFNQLTYTKNLVNWWQFYYPKNKVVIIDNGSTYEPLLKWYETFQIGVRRVKYKENTPTQNLRKYLDDFKPEYYVISDPDIMPHPNTPFDFLEIFKDIVDKGYHHVGFQLIIDDLPSWLHNKENVKHNELQLRHEPISVNGHMAFKAPIDTTFALYTSKNGGWESPMSGEAWSNSLRMFNAFHLAWYLDGEKLNPEMKNYYSTAAYHKPGEPSACRNNYRPKQFYE